MSIAVLTDSTSDMTPAMQEALGVTIVPLYVNFQNRVLKDNLEIKTDEVFAGIKAGAAMPSTSQPTPADFMSAYEKLLQTHEKVLSIHISSKLSGTLASAELASRDFGGRVVTFDSEVSSGNQSMMCERAVKMFKAGASLADVLMALERARKASNLRFCVGSLDFLKKNGRIGGAQALIGGLLNIKPILHLVNGKIEAAGRARGSKAALDDVVNNLRTYQAKHGRVRTAYIYTDKPEDVEPLRKAGHEMGVEEFSVTQTGTVIASHVGPGTYGALSEPIDV
jgi:DegV family protein with EDD domain